MRNDGTPVFWENFLGKNFQVFLRSDLIMPKTTDEHDRFNLGRIKKLVLNDIFLENFDILSYSDMLYWIELFNIMLLEGKDISNYAEDKKEYFFLNV